MPTQNELSTAGVAYAQPESDTESWFSQVANSKTFQAAPMLRTLLLFLWEHRGENISEYAIATEALGRRSDFNAKTDATVRVQVARLRVKLKEFYETQEGFPLLISVPLGGHELHCEPRPTAAPPDSPASHAPPNRSAILAVLVCAVIALAVLSGVLWVDNRKLHSTQRPASKPLPRFWQTFLANGRPTSIVVANPLLFHWREQEVMVRDQKILEIANWRNSPLLRDLAAKWGQPVANEAWMTAPEALASAQLLQYFDRNEKPARFIAASRIPIDLTNQENVIFVNGPRASVYLSDLLEQINFHVLKTFPTVIGNRKPKTGESAEFREIVLSNQHRTCPALIALLPKSPHGTRSLVFVGRCSTALVSMLLSEEGLEMVDRQWSGTGRPDAWEMVVELELRGDTVLRMQPLASREIKSANFDSDRP